MFQHYPSLQQKEKVSRWLLLGGSAAPILGAFLYNFGFRVTSGPCLFQQMVGIPSPACGMTRSFMAIARGDWQQALAYHAFGPVLFSLLLLTASHLAIELITGKKWPIGYVRPVAKPWFGIGGVLLFLGYYAVRLYVRYYISLPSDGSFPILWQSFIDGAKAL